MAHKAYLMTDGMTRFMTGIITHSTWASLQWVITRHMAQSCVVDTMFYIMSFNEKQTIGHNFQFEDHTVSFTYCIPTFLNTLASQISLCSSGQTSSRDSNKHFNSEGENVSSAFLVHFLTNDVASAPAWQWLRRSPLKWPKGKTDVAKSIFYGNWAWCSSPAS